MTPGWVISEQPRCFPWPSRSLPSAISARRLSHVMLFWAAFILTRPLGATIGDFLDKPLDDGGLALSRPLASGVLAVVILICVLLIPQRAGRHPAAAAAS